MKHIKLIQKYMDLINRGDTAPWTAFEVVVLSDNTSHKLTKVTLTNKVWRPMKKTEWFTDSNLDFREKPQPISINGILVPCPETVKPICGTTYFIPYIYGKSDDGAKSYIWENSYDDNIRFSKGLVHLSCLSAVIHSNAILNCMNV